MSNRQGAAAVFGIAIIVALFGLNELVRPRQSSDPSSVTGAVANRTYHLPAQFPLGYDTQLVTDTGQRAGSSIWALTPRSGALATDELAVSENAVAARKGARVPAEPSQYALGAGISSWGSRHPNAIFLLAAKGTVIGVVVRDLASGRWLASAETPPLPPAKGGRRNVAITARSGRLPDLVVVDRPQSGSPIRVLAYSGESGFRTKIVDAVVGGPPFEPATWSLQIGSVSSVSSDLLFDKLISGASPEQVEVHASLGTQLYQGFGEQRVIPLPADAGRPFEPVLAHLNGLPVLYVIDRANRLINLLGL